MDSRLTAKLSRIYYSPRGYWKGVTAIKHLASAAKVSEDVAKDWLKRQAIWQIYLPAPRRIPRPRFDVSTPNKVHQADLLFLPHDRLPRGKKVYKYALTVVDVASRFKEAEPLTSKTAAEVADALSRIYKRGPLKWPKLLQVDPGREFMGAAGQLLAKHGVSVRRGRVDNSQGPGRRGTLQPHLGWTAIRASAGTRTCADAHEIRGIWWAVAGVGEKAPCGHCRPEWRGDKADWQAA